MGKRNLKFGDKTVTTYVGKTQTSATLKRFLVGHKGAEMTGICENADMNHVGDASKLESQWPTNAGYGAGRPPSSATLVIKKNDGGLIGS